MRTELTVLLYPNADVLLSFQSHLYLPTLSSTYALHVFVWKNH